MSKLFVLAILLACASALRSQVGVTGGLNSARYSYVSDRGRLLSFNAGVLYRRAQWHSIVWQPTLQYTGKGATVYPANNVGGGSSIEKYINRLDFVQLSAPWLIGPTLGRLFRFEIGGGPYVALMVQAEQTQQRSDGTEATVHFRIGGRDADFTPFDAGIHFATGFLVVGRLGFHVQYNLGLANMRAGAAEPALKMRNTSLNLSYCFQKKRASPVVLR